MPHARLAAFTLLTVLLLTAGCLADLERDPLETSWEASSTLHATPTPLTHETPTQATIEGSLTISPDATIQLTGIEAQLETANRTTPLIPVHAIYNAATQPAHTFLDEDPELADGDTLHFTFLPREPHLLPLPQEDHTLTAELLYRYRDGDAFDAGRITHEANLTPSNDTTLGTGATHSTDGATNQIIFKDLDEESTQGPATIHLYHVTDDVTHEATLDANLSHGEGVAILTLDEPQLAREGDGYLLYHVTAGGDQGIAHTRDQPIEDALPGPTAVILMLAILAASLLARRSI